MCFAITFCRLKQQSSYYFIIKCCREEAAYVINKFNGMGSSQFWIGYQNINGTYQWDGKPVGTNYYLPQWNSAHTGMRATLTSYSLQKSS